MWHTCCHRWAARAWAAPPTTPTHRGHASSIGTVGKGVGGGVTRCIMTRSMAVATRLHSCTLTPRRGRSLRLDGDICSFDEVRLHHPLRVQYSSRTRNSSSGKADRAQRLLGGRRSSTSCVILFMSRKAEASEAEQLRKRGQIWCQKSV